MRLDHVVDAKTEDIFRTHATDNESKAQVAARIAKIAKKKLGKKDSSIRDPTIKEQWVALNQILNVAHRMLNESAGKVPSVPIFATFSGSRSSTGSSSTHPSPKVPKTLSGGAPLSVPVTTSPSLRRRKVAEASGFAEWFKAHHCAGLAKHTVSGEMEKLERLSVTGRGLKLISDTLVGRLHGLVPKQVQRIRNDTRKK